MSVSYDVVFMSSGELNAEENWQTLLKLYPTAKRVDGAPSIYDAFYAASYAAEEDIFLMVDGDTILLTNELDLESDYNQWRIKQVRADKAVMLWRAGNRVNTIMNGHGSVKMFSRKSLRKGFKGTDVTMGMGLSLTTVQDLISIHAFDYDEYNTWKTAFRESAKLVYNTFFMSPTWVHVWCNEGFGPFGKYSIAGAQAGAKFARDNSEGALTMVNKRDWLLSEYVRWKEKYDKN